MLNRYAKKRDFARTPEPPPAERSASQGPLTFVVHKHAARRLHYDLRLECDGVLKSWAVPKGPSLDPSQRRLAVMVEDHPLDYGPFEGVIPEKQYGAGEVIVWDSGTYAPDEDGDLSFDDVARAETRVREGLERGKLSVTFRGAKLKGSWALVRTKRAPNDWLLLKHKDRYADPARDILAEDRSVRSGLTIEDLKAGRKPAVDGLRAAAKPSDVPGARRAPFPQSAAPMQASLAEGPFSHPDWAFEPKLDGVRVVAFINDGEVRLRSRRELDATKQYPALAAELAAQPGRLVLDGEVVALDDAGRPSFQRLQQRLNLMRDADIQRADREIPVVYYVFDLLHWDGYDVRGATLEGRKALLRRALQPSPRVLLLDHIEEEGIASYEAALEHGLEGVVAKRLDSRYESGKRSRSWLKVKATASDDFVVAGFTEGKGARRGTFGALLLGQYDGGRLCYAGHVGSGFDDATLAALRARLDALRTDDRPFAEQPPANGPATWVRPELVVEVKFAERTQEGLLRAPVFLHLRPDKAAGEAVRAEVVEPPANASEPGTVEPASQREVEDVLRQLERPVDRLTLEVEGHRLPLSNLNKELWPATDEHRAFTKRDLIAYFARVSPCLLPHMRDRPITLTRYPHGIAAGHFYQKHWEHEPPAFVQTALMFSERNGRDSSYLLCNNLSTLLWLGQIADLELHTQYARVNPEPDGHHLSDRFSGSLANLEESLLNYPDFVVFDLDPYIYSGREAKGDEPALNREAFAKTCEVALQLKAVLDGLSLPAFVKTTGRTGLHIYVPILRQYDYDAVRAIAETVGRFVVAAMPRDVTMEWTVEKRRGKVFFDYNQNMRGKTLASIYSPRPSPEATVSMPLRWDELGTAYPTDFTLLTAPERLARVGDLWSGILDAKADLGALLSPTAAAGPLENAADKAHAGRRRSPSRAGQ